MLFYLAAPCRILSYFVLGQQRLRLGLRLGGRGKVISLVAISFRFFSLSWSLFCYWVGTAAAAAAACVYAPQPCFVKGCLALPCVSLLNFHFFHSSHLCRRCHATPSNSNSNPSLTHKPRRAASYQHKYQLARQVVNTQYHHNDDNAALRHGDDGRRQARRVVGALSAAFGVSARRR
jgi:hypothetical protein